jgi:chlorobactene glucosyltransferase
MNYSGAVLLALPWIIPQFVTWFRVRGSRSLDDESAIPPRDPPRVSVIVPARNEGHNIGRCVTSILQTTYPNVEVIVVDDASTDGTGDLAREIAARDPRLVVLQNEPLPDGWFGKQWACSNGARTASGAILQFTDADTVHSPDLLPRSVNALLRTRADIFSVAGRQELGGFWERLVQPQIFSILAMRYGGTESVNDSARKSDKIANGQCIFVDRRAYEEVGGHGSVRSTVAEDLMLAQLFFAQGKKLVLMLGVSQLSTRMYSSLGDLIEGWRKNVFAGGIDAVPLGRIGRALFPFLLLLPPIMGLAPPIALGVAALGIGTPDLLVWAAISTTAMFAWWVVAYATVRESPLYAFLFPLGSLILLYIFAGAIVRGRRVTWKGRNYISR